MKILFLIIGLISASAFANEEAKELHQESCLNCHIDNHDKAFYTEERDKTNITSLSELAGQVSVCAQTLGVGWFPDEEKSVVDYLNKQYYMFKVKNTLNTH